MIFCRNVFTYYSILSNCIWPLHLYFAIYTASYVSFMPSHHLWWLNKPLVETKKFRKKIVDLHCITNPIYSGPARQCCYDELGRLIIGPTAGGHSDLSSVYSQIIPPSIAMTVHLQQDITPFIQCCKSNVTSCTTFFSFRPSAESECQYNPPPPGMF